MISPIGIDAILAIVVAVLVIVCVQERAKESP